MFEFHWRDSIFGMATSLTMEFKHLHTLSKVTAPVLPPPPLAPCQPVGAVAAQVGQLERSLGPRCGCGNGEPEVCCRVGELEQTREHD